MRQRSILITLFGLFVAVALLMAIKHRSPEQSHIDGELRFGSQTDRIFVSRVAGFAVYWSVRHPVMLLISVAVATVIVWRNGRPNRVTLLLVAGFTCLCLLIPVGLFGFVNTLKLAVGLTVLSVIYPWIGPGLVNVNQQGEIIGNARDDAGMADFLQLLPFSFVVYVIIGLISHFIHYEGLFG